MWFACLWRRQGSLPGAAGASFAQVGDVVVEGAGADAE